MVTVDVWTARLDVDEPTLRAMERTLSEEERAYARGVIDPLTRWRWVADHGWRRRLLGRLTARAPEQVAYVLNEHGRPDLAASRLSFSASRGGAVVVYAVCEGGVVGVDVEALRDDFEIEPFARRFFTPAERAALEPMHGAVKQAACFDCWTRKEAYAKAMGTGLAFPLNELEVWAGDDRSVRCGAFEISSLALGDGLAGAVATQSAPETSCQIRVSELR